MQATECRVCGHPFFAEPLLSYGNMPGAAQFMPGPDTLADDEAIVLEVCQCTGCGLVQLTNEPVDYYRDVIRAAAVSEEMQEFRTGQFADFVNRFSLTGKKVVEIGCGRGEFLGIMQGCGVDAYGLEHAKGSVAECLKTGLRVSQGFVEEAGYQIENGPFDAFCILNFLEHMPAPGATLSGIHHNLSEGAVGLVEVPNFDMMLRNKLFSEFVRDHLTYFTKDTLTSTLLSNGFEILECSEIWYDYILSATVRKRGKLDIAHFDDHQSQVHKAVHEYLERFSHSGVAVWGAGHQALAVIAMLELADSVKYVVDSAPFKQGKFTPATHLPIVSPEHLVSDPVGAVIIMAASYSDEVAKIVRERFDPGLGVAILRDSGLEIID